MDEITNFKEKIQSLRSKKLYLEAFLVQSAYIESVIRRLYNHNLVVEVKDNVVEAIIKPNQNVRSIIHFCFKAKWLNLEAYLLRKRVNLSFKDIGTVLKKDHTTIVHACQKMDAYFSKSHHDK